MYISFRAGIRITKVREYPCAECFLICFQRLPLPTRIRRCAHRKTKCWNTISNLRTLSLVPLSWQQKKTAICTCRAVAVCPLLALVLSLLLWWSTCLNFNSAHANPSMYCGKAVASVNSSERHCVPTNNARQLRQREVEGKQSARRRSNVKKWWVTGKPAALSF